MHPGPDRATAADDFRLRAATPTRVPGDAVRTVIARAPTRIDFGGGWTDVPPYTVEQGGFVCNLAIARHATARLSASAGACVIVEGGEEVRAPSVDAFARDGRAEMAKAALRRARIGTARLELESDFPRGAGLGGSSAAGVVLAAATAAWRGESPPRAELAERSRALEIEELHVPGGSQDHYAAALGGALALRFDERVHWRTIPLAPELVQAIERRCIVAYTGESRISGQTITAVLDAYRARVPRVTAALARMKALAEMMSDALERGDLDELAALVGEHWEYQRALHPAITTPAIERLLAAAREAGAQGGKALGASGGGSVLVIAPDDRAGAVRDAAARVAEPLPFRVDLQGVRIERTG